MNSSLDTDSTSESPQDSVFEKDNSSSSQNEGSAPTSISDISRCGVNFYFFFKRIFLSNVSELGNVLFMKFLLQVLRAIHMQGKRGMFF